MHALPLEGLTGRLVVDTLVHYLNFPGAAIVISSMVLILLYLSTTFSFSTAQQWMAIRFAFALAWRDRFRNWRSAWAKNRLEKKILAKAQEPEKKAVKRAQPREDEEERIAASRHAAYAGTPAATEQAPKATPPEKHTPSVWNQMPRTSIPDPEPEELEADEVEEIAAVAAPAAKAISVKGRADADARPVTLAPRADSGFRLPPSTLLHRSDESQIVREDDLRSQAKILVEKCAEFDVCGQVVQINPGPVVTTFEFKPEAGVKYSRVTGLAEDLCLAMRAESILIERMAGKSTVGIQVPNHDRETIWLRDVIESENFTQTKSKLTLAMGKDINGRTGDRRSGHHAPRPDRGFYRQRQVCSHQCHDHVCAV